MSEYIKEAHLIENFVSWQGEGPDSGRTMIILRFKTCNLRCHWCDTAVKMRVSAEAPYKLSDIQKTIKDRKAGILVTGGEPTVPKHFDEAVSLLNNLTYPVANVESNGFRLYEFIQEVSPRKPVKFMFSPKIFNSDDRKIAIQTAEKIVGHHNVYVKVVWDGNPATKAFLAWLSHQDDLLEEHRIWVMPQGVTRAELIKNAEETFDICEEFRMCFSSRSHLIFGFV
ncbi:MAG: radical SAM protein [Candidatus Heimdallarchaeaceae archaeon]